MKIDFILIGAGRCGTTWIYNCLMEHPDIFVPNSKRLYFFNENYDKGLDYYKFHFRSCKQKSYKAVGECCTAYLADDTCVKKIFDCFPKVKLIAILRDPVERAFSQFSMFNKSDKKTFENAVVKHPKLLKSGLYYNHLQNYYKYFKKEQMLILLFDDLKANAQELIQKCYEFIGVDCTFVPNLINKPVNMIIFPKLKRILRKTHMEWVIEVVKMTLLDNYLRQFALQKRGKSYPQMKLETKSRLSEYYKIPNENLSRLLERDLSNWT